jgi:probable HAF family extracellular repeat protein
VPSGSTLSVWRFVEKTTKNNIPVNSRSSNICVSRRLNRQHEECAAETRLDLEGHKLNERSYMIGRLKSVAAATALLSALGCVPVSAQVSFKSFGVVNAYINDMSADGSVAVGILLGSSTAPSPAGSQAFRWTAAGGVQNIGGHMNEVYISRDGKTIVGSALDAQGNKNAAIWSGGTNWKLLGGPPGSVPQGSVLSNGYGVSGDGSVVVGLANYPTSQQFGTQNRAFRWDAVNGMVDLGALQQGGTTLAFTISADGNTIIGYERPPKGTSYNPSVSGMSGVIFWNGTERLLHAFGMAGEAFATNFNGAIIVGRGHPQGGSYLPNGTFRGAITTYMYTAWDGRFEDLGAVLLLVPVPGGGIDYASTPTAVSDYGEVVGGTTGNYDHLPFIWTQATGMVLLTDYLTANGVTAHQGWKLTDVSYISPDGKRMVGTGISPQGATSWIVTLP